MDELHLRRIIRGLVDYSLLSTLFIVGCSGEDDPVAQPFWADLPLDEFEPPVCEGAEWQATAGLVATWANTRLSDESRERVEWARRLSVEELQRELEATVPKDLSSVAGVPVPVVALDLMQGLDRALWTRRVPRSS